MKIDEQALEQMDAAQLREYTHNLLFQLRHKSALLDKLTHEIALLKRMRFAAKSEHLAAQQRSLLEDEIEEDLSALSQEIAQLEADKTMPQAKAQPKRKALPADLPRKIIHHDPSSST